MSAEHLPQNQLQQEELPGVEYSAEAIAYAFHQAQNSLVQTTNAPVFHERLVRDGIDPFDMDKPGYWQSFAEHVSEEVQTETFQNGEDLGLRSKELLSAFPDYIFAHSRLEKDIQDDKKKYREDRETASYFNDLLCNFATEFPETRVSDVKAALLSFANIALESDEDKRRATNQAPRLLRGAQRELSYMQAVQATGRAVSFSDIDGDLQGVDLIVQGRHRTLYIDVKSNINDVKKQNNGIPAPFAVKEDNITMYSMLRDQDFDDKFFLSEKTVAERAPLIDEQLLAAEEAQDHLLGDYSRDYTRAA